MKAKLALGAGAIFVTGVFVGDTLAVKRIRNKLNNLVPLMGNGISSVLYKAVERNLDQKQIKELLDEEFKFIQLVSK